VYCRYVCLDLSGSFEIEFQISFSLISLSTRYLSAAVLLRGAPGEVKVQDARAAISEMVNPTTSHREKLQFLPWLDGGGRIIIETAVLAMAGWRR
jgi:hypothetical protein